MPATGDGSPRELLLAAARRAERASTAVEAMRASWAVLAGSGRAFSAWSRAERVRPDILYTHVLGGSRTPAGVSGSLRDAAAGLPHGARGRAR